MISNVPFKLDNCHFSMYIRCDELTWENSSDAVRGVFRDNVKKALTDRVARAKVETVRLPHHVELRADVYVFTPAELFAMVEHIRNEALPRPVKYVDPVRPIEDTF